MARQRCRVCRKYSTTTSLDGSLVSTAKIYTYAPIICTTVYLLFCVLQKGNYLIQTPRRFAKRWRRARLIITPLARTRPPFLFSSMPVHMCCDLLHCWCCAFDQALCAACLQTVLLNVCSECCLHAPTSVNQMLLPGFMIRSSSMLLTPTLGISVRSATARARHCVIL